MLNLLCHLHLVQGQRFQPAEERLPDVRCPYSAPNVCNGTDGTAGAASLIASVVSTIGMIAVVILLL